MVRPCVARGFIDLSALRSCINVSGLGLERFGAPGHHGYQRACVLISGQASNGPFGSPVFACAGKTGPPFRFILSQTSAGKRDYVIALSLISVSSFVRAVRPFLRPGLHVVRGIARRGRQGWPSRLARLWCRRLQATP